MAQLDQVKAFIIDLDGVLWRGNQYLPGVREFFQFLRTRPFPFTLATNNATASPDRIVSRLAEYGVQVQPGEVLTSSIATAGYLRNRLAPGSRIYAIGEAALREALDAAGFQRVDQADDVKAVVVGYDREITYTKLVEACLAVSAGAEFVGTNPDLSFPTERGEAPGNGAFLAAIRATTGIDPIVVGKPEPHLYLQAQSNLGIPAKNVLAVGDRLTTDVAGAHNAGMLSALLLTGVTTLAAAEESSIKADWIFDDLHALIEAFSS
jgi:4-nitrophenyl phosphatase